MVKLVAKKNGEAPKSDVERMGRIREAIGTELGRSSENLEITVSMLQERLKKYERRYEISSISMVEKVRSGAMPETRDITLWVWSWQILERLNRVTPTTGTL